MQTCCKTRWRKLYFTHRPRRIRRSWRSADVSVSSCSAALTSTLVFGGSLTLVFGDSLFTSASSPMPLWLRLAGISLCREILLWTGPVLWTGLDETARRSEPLPLVTCRCCSFDRAALWDFFHLLREPGSAGPVSDRRLAVDQASDSAIDCAGRVGFGSSCCFLSWEHDSNGSEPATFR
jgi:hypothetical protein